MGLILMAVDYILVQEAPCATRFSYSELSTNKLAPTEKLSKMIGWG
jgi:hypothetical protein